MMSNNIIFDPMSLTKYKEFIGEGAEEFIIEVIATFKTEYMKLYDQLKSAFYEKNPSIVRKMAHTLRPSCATIGAISLSEKYRQLEEMGATDDLGEAEAILDSCELDYELLCEKLDAWIQLLRATD
jgi:HPt (histidine-containing phosphotransfer) domain-containing protein